MPRRTYLCCILYCKCGVDHGMGSQITLCKGHSKFGLCFLFPWNKCHFPCFPKPLGRTPLSMSYLAICLPRRIKKRPIDGRSANKRMVGRKLEMSTRSGSNYLTLAGKSPFWYQIALGALRPGFMSILVLQSS